MALQTSTTVDWIEGTVSDSCDNALHLKTLAGRLTNTPTASWHDDKAFNRYSIGARHESGMRALTGRADMGTHLIASGSALTALRGADCSEIDLLNMLHDQDWHATRIDLAIDAIDSNLKPLALLRACERGKLESKARTWYLVRSGNNGWTLYIGAPQSEKHMRVYNKYAEIKHRAAAPPGVDNWVRLELVLMHVWARRAARVLCAAATPDLAASLIKAYANIPSSTAWVAVLDRPLSDLGTSTRKVTDTKRWLLEVVSGVLARESLADPKTYMAFVQKVQDQFIELADRSRERTVNQKVDKPNDR